MDFCKNLILIRILAGHKGMSRCQAINGRCHNPGKRGPDISMMEIDDNRAVCR